MPKPSFKGCVLFFLIFFKGKECCITLYKNINKRGIILEFLVIGKHYVFICMCIVYHPVCMYVCMFVCNVFIFCRVTIKDLREEEEA